MLVRLRSERGRQRECWITCGWRNGNGHGLRRGEANYDGESVIRAVQQVRCVRRFALRRLIDHSFMSGGDREHAGPADVTRQLHVTGQGFVEPGGGGGGSLNV